MPLLWLRVALVLYGVGVVYVLLSLARKAAWLERLLAPAILAGAVFHFVSLAELSIGRGDFVPASAHHAESLLAFLVVCFFLAFWSKYRTATPGTVVFPLAFLLLLPSIFGEPAPEFSSPLLRSSGIFFHVALIFLGYAALLFSFVASLLYLVQERRLKAKSPKIWRLPPLEVIDQISYRSLLIGFPFITLGLLAGAVVAQQRFGASFFHDTKIVLSLVVWAVYMILLLTRWNAGWRGRKAALLATFGFLAAVGTWTANYISGTHRFLSP